MLLSLQLLLPAVAFAAAASPGSRMDLAIDDPRPVARATEQLMQDYGYAISYEDPRYAYSEDIKDVTSEVSTSTAAAGKARTVLVPAGGVLELRNFAAPARDKPQSIAALLQAVLDVQATRSNGGQFRLRQSGGRFHIEPARIRNSAGAWIDQSSLLDAPIVIAAERRHGLQALEAFATALKQATGQSVGVGTVPLNLLAATRVDFGADGDIARDVLVRMLDATGRRIAWRLLYAPDLRTYALNLRIAPDDPPAARDASPIPSRQETSITPAGVMESKPGDR